MTLGAEETGRVLSLSVLPLSTALDFRLLLHDRLSDSYEMSEVLLAKAGFDETLQLLTAAWKREWLAAQGRDLQNDHANADEGSRDRLYLHYGYFIGLKRALALLTNRGETLH